MSKRFFTHSFIALCALGALAVAYQTQGTDGQSAHDKSKVVNPDNPIVCEPLVVFDESGMTLSGLSSRHFVIYSNGLASLMEIIPGEPSRAQTKMLDEGLCEMLCVQLQGQGAMQLKDQDEGVVMDAPLSTVTVFQGESDAMAHTFSYTIPSGPYKQVDGLIEDFIQQTLPLRR